MSVETPTTNLSAVKRALLALEEMQARIDAIERAKTEPIAIIGMGCRLPGGANSPEEFWHLLEQGGDAIGEIPADRWDVEQLYDPDPNAPGKISTRWGAFLADVDHFDPAFFGISPREAEAMDPQQRVFLEVAWEALEDAGQSTERISGSQTGVFVGVCSNDYERLQYSVPEQIGIYTGTGGVANIIAGRLSYLFNLQGPSLVVDTACSSSLVAIHLACQSLRAGESTMAVAGGVNLLLLPERFICSSRMQMMAADGRCKTFDMRADGFVRGEGCGVVILKRLSDALKDGDPIHALIRGSASNQDGRSASLTAPNMLAQQAVIRQAVVNAGIDPAQVGYVETHGTGTPLGDPIEVEALSAIYGQPRRDGSSCVLGALKTNMGHLESAAGVAGLIKTVLALRHEAIPPHLHFTALNPSISFEQTPFQLATELRLWPKGERPRYAGISSFGWSGTNVHMVLEEAPDRSAADTQAISTEQAYVVPLSARSGAALRALAQRYQTLLAAPSAPALPDLAFTTSCRRSHHPHRLALTVSSPAELRALLDAFLAGSPSAAVAEGLAPPSPPKLAFVFPGQGAQWPGMARQLYAHAPPFRCAFDQCAQACQPFLASSLVDELHAATPSSAIDIVQPLLFAIAVSLSALWQHYGVRPSAVVGHSMGEVAAAYVAGALALDDAAQIICRRSRLLRTLSGQGAMALVELSVAEAEQAIAGVAERVSVAVSNSPRATVLSGEVAALAAVLADLEARQVFCRHIQVDVASHSPQMEPLAPALRLALAAIQPRAGRVPFYSTVEQRVLDGHELDASYWMDNLRQPVQFSNAIAQLVADGVTLFVELSPHPILLPAITSGLQERGETGTTLASMRREADERATLLAALGALYAAGVAVDWRAVAPSGRCVELPRYPWQHARYWLTPAARATSGVTARAAGGAGLLGERRTLAGQVGLETWEREVGLAQQAYLAEHQVAGRAVLPGAAYLALALAGARELWGEGAHTLSDVRLLQMLNLDPDTSYALQLSIAEESSDTARWQIYSRRDGAGWTQHASGLLRRADASAPEPLDLAAIQALNFDTLSAHAHYEALAAQGLEYGPDFCGVAGVHCRPGEALARIERPAGIVTSGDTFHPALLDAALQALIVAMPQEQGSTAVPVAIAEVRAYDRLDELAWSYARVRETADGSAQPLGDVVLLDAAGRVLLEARGIQVQRLRVPQPDRIPGWLHTLAWQPQALTGAGANTTERSKWLIVADTVETAQPLADALVNRSSTCAVVAAQANEAPDYQHSNAEMAPLQAALHDLATDGIRCRDVVVIASGTATHDDAIPAAAAYHWARVVALVQALVQAGWRDAPRLWLITRGVQAVTPNDRVPALSIAPLWGLGRTVVYEHPELHCTLLDLPAEPLLDEAAIVATELLEQTAESQIALRPEGRFVARLQRYTPNQDQPASLEACAPGTPIASDGTYLITGGLGGIGLQVAHWLVAQGARSLALLGRRAPSPAALDAITALRATGACVLVAAADVADRAALASVLADIARSLPPVRGIFHAAGVLDDAALLQLDPPRFATVAAPKIAGAWHLHTLTRQLPLDHFVLFSSGAALLGSPGQANYAAANAFLDALAHARRASGRPALSINWGPWAEVGLAAQSATRGERLAYRGIASMSVAQGLEALGRLLQHQAAQVAVLPLTFRQWRQYYPRVAALPQFSALAAELPQNGSRQQRANKMRASIALAESAKRLGLLEAHLADRLHRVLRVPLDQIGRHTPFGAIGLDSLTAMELRNCLEDSLELRFPVTLLWNYQTIAALATHLLEKIGIPAQAGATADTGQAVPDAQHAELAGVLGELAEFSLDDLQQTAMVETATRENRDA